jgi:hypothetical protein
MVEVILYRKGGCMPGKARAEDADPGSLFKRRRRRDFALHNI